MVSLAQIQEAQQRIRGVALRTPLVRFPFAGEERKKQLWLKPENLQPIGSFKLRGGYNKVALLSEAQRQRGVVTYSSGNHAQAVAYCAREFGIRAVIVMPSNAPKVKIENTRALGAEIVFVGPGSDERKAKADELSAKHGYAVVPPYNDEEIIAGQGTIGLEILEDLPDVALVLAPIGGGGLIAGVSSAIKQTRKQVKVVGVEPALVGKAQASLRAGHVVTISAEQAVSTVADGLRTQSVGEIPFAIMRQYVDDIVMVSEDEIFHSMRRMLFETRLVPEPSGAVTLAAFLFHSHKLPVSGKTVAVVSGGSVEPELLRTLLADKLQ